MIFARQTPTSCPSRKLYPIQAGKPTDGIYAKSCWNKLVEMLFVQNDHVIEALPTDLSNDPFGASAPNCC